MIWKQIQTVKWSKSELHVIWLALANAYGSVPHQLIHFVLNLFHMPPCIQNLVATYFNNFHVYYTTQEISLVPAGERDSNGLLHLPHCLLSRWCEE